MENNEISFNEEIKAYKQSLKKRIKTLKKSLDKLQLHLKECNHWPQLQHEAELISAHFHLIKKGAQEVFVEDWAKEGVSLKISLNPRLKIHEDLAKRFKKVQKLKKGLPFAIRETDRTLLALKEAEALFCKIESVGSEEEWNELKVHCQKPQEKFESVKKAPSKPYFEFFSKSGIRIWVGKTASKNEELTFRYASGNDFWLHVSEYPGSHVVIHPISGQKVDDETMNEALQLALYYSKARKFKEAEVAFTHVKHVRRVGNQKGKVQISSEKRVFVTLLPL